MRTNFVRIKRYLTQNMASVFTPNASMVVLTRLLAHKDKKARKLANDWEKLRVVKKFFMM